MIHYGLGGMAFAKTKNPTAGFGSGVISCKINSTPDCRPAQQSEIQKQSDVYIPKHRGVG
jgi:hypothetical protein